MAIIYLEVIKMGSGSISYKNLPKKKKVYGDKEFFVRPITYGLDETYEAILVRPAKTMASDEDKGEFPFLVEGEFSIGEERLKEVKKEFKDVDVEYVYFESEEHLFAPEQLEKVMLYCDRSI